MKNFESVKNLLPKVVLQIAELIGYPATEKLIKNMGGLQLFIAHKFDKMEKQRAELLVSSIGKQNALLFCELFRGETLYIPRCLNALRELRNQSLLRDIDNLRMCGYSIAQSLIELCPKYDISDRFAWELLRKQKQTSNQPTLF